MSLCHFVTMSLCHYVTMSICHFVTISLYHYVTLSLCHFVTISLCHFVTLSLYHYVTLSLYIDVPVRRTFWSLSKPSLGLMRGRQGWCPPNSSATFSDTWGSTPPRRSSRISPSRSIRM